MPNVLVHLAANQALHLDTRDASTLESELLHTSPGKDKLEDSAAKALASTGGGLTAARHAPVKLSGSPS